MAVEEKGCKLILDLKCQSPMIHFQQNQKGVTLRASEVKPKLDKYLLKNNREKLKKYIKKDTEALDYKMQIFSLCKPNSVSVGRGKSPYDIYFGSIKNAVKFDCRIEITCFYTGLKEEIKNNIEDFFIAYNFGTMQGKGFGSFVPNQYNRDQLKPEQIQHIGDVLKKHTGSEEFYYVNADKTKIFMFIKFFYKIMKSGYNQRNLYVKSYLSKYMHEQGIDNEKAWMKHNNISPDIYDFSKRTWSKEWENGRKSQPCINPKYVRGLLGIANGISYKEGTDSNKRINIKISNNEIERTISPIYFKVISNYVFIVAKRIPKDIYGKEFNFYNKNTRISDKLPVPNEAEFDIDVFLNSYVDYFNDNEIIKEIKNKEHIKNLTIESGRTQE